MLFVKSFVVIGLLWATLTLVACGGGDPTGTTQAGRRVASNEPGESQPLPKIQVPTGQPPKKLVIKDLKIGSGPVVKATDAIAVAYEGVSYKTGKQFDLRTRSEPFFFQTGVGRVMPGFDQGVIGMKIGGLREVIIPPSLTLNELGKPETLVYVIELLLDESGAEYKHRMAHGESLPLPQFH